jgi:hypothetical protein
MERDKTLFAKCDAGLHDAATHAAYQLNIPLAEFIRRAVTAAAQYTDDLTAGGSLDLDARLDKAFGPLPS